MTKKNNIRSIRFSDEIMEMIEQQPGDNFTQKFEYLVTRCMFELPAKEKEISEIEKRIKERREELQIVLNRISDLQVMAESIGSKMKWLNQTVDAYVKKK